jgi:hypothetical protein
MKADGLKRRLVALEGVSEPGMVKTSWQWMNEDGTPAGPVIERLVTRRREFKFEWIDEK